MLRALLLTAVCTTALPLPAASAEPVLSQYRGVTLGDSVQVVVDRLKVTTSDVKVVYERPTLVQQITWRPNRFVSGTSVEPDPLAEMVLTFNLGRLARIAVTYDRERTQGLTNTDLLEALSGVYGLAMLTSTISTTPSSTEPETVGSWSDSGPSCCSDASYASRLSLTIPSIADVLMQGNHRRRVRLDASETAGAGPGASRADRQPFRAGRRSARQQGCVQALITVTS
jgi:hypothetical protein